MNETSTQGQRLRELRLDCRYTQEYVAAQLGTTKQAVYKYEADLIKNIPTDKLLRLSQLFRCSPAWIQGLSHERGTPPISTASAPLLDVPCGTPHRTRNDAPIAADDQFTYYRDLMDVMLHLTPAERQSVMHFAQFLAAQYQPPATEE